MEVWLCHWYWRGLCFFCFPLCKRASVWCVRVCGCVFVCSCVQPDPRGASCGGHPGRPDQTLPGNEQRRLSLHLCRSPQKHVAMTIIMIFISRTKSFSGLAVRQQTHYCFIITSHLNHSVALWVICHMALASDIVASEDWFQIPQLPFLFLPPVILWLRISPEISSFPAKDIHALTPRIYFLERARNVVSAEDYFKDFSFSALTVGDVEAITRRINRQQHANKQQCQVKT